jgi:transposase
LITNNGKLESKTVLEYYLKRWKIEEDFNKMKDLGLEEVRLMSIKKIQNLVAIIQFIIILSQDVFNEVMQKKTIVMEHIYMFFVKFCKWKTLTLNPQSFIKFISQGLTPYKSYNTSLEPMDTLF